MKGQEISVLSMGSLVSGTLGKALVTSQIILILSDISFFGPFSLTFNKFKGLLHSTIFACCSKLAYE